MKLSEQLYTVKLPGLILSSSRQFNQPFPPTTAQRAPRFCASPRCASTQQARGGERFCGPYKNDGTYALFFSALVPLRFYPSESVSKELSPPRACVLPPIPTRKIPIS